MRPAQASYGGVLVIATVFSMRPFMRKLYADGGYQGLQLQGGLRPVMRGINGQIVDRLDAATAFTVMPTRWIVERTSTWLNHCRRLAKGLGMPKPQSTRVPPSCLNFAYGADAMPNQHVIPDGY